MPKPKPYTTCPECNEGILLKGHTKEFTGSKCSECGHKVETDTFKPWTLPDVFNGIEDSLSIVKVLPFKAKSVIEKERKLFLFILHVGDGQYKDHYYLCFVNPQIGRAIPPHLLAMSYGPMLGICVYPPESDGSSIEGTKGMVNPTNGVHILTKEMYEQLLVEFDRWEGTGVTNIMFMMPKENSLDAAFQYVASRIPEFYKNENTRSEIALGIKCFCPAIELSVIDEYLEPFYNGTVSETSMKDKE